MEATGVRVCHVYLLTYNRDLYLINFFPITKHFAYLKSKVLSKVLLIMVANFTQLSFCIIVQSIGTQ